MGFRANNVINYVCEYGGSVFNQSKEEVYDMLTGHDIEIKEVSDSWDKARWEIENIEAIREYIRKLREKKPDVVNYYFRNSSFHKYTNEEVIDILESWIQHIDKTDNKVMIDWF